MFVADVHYETLHSSCAAAAQQQTYNGGDMYSSSSSSGVLWLQAMHLMGLRAPATAVVCI
jgi:hypothetical protein